MNLVCLPRRSAACALAAALAACSTNPPLLFGDQVTFGLGIGNEAASGGAAVSLGYRQHSVAIVPLSVLDEHGQAYAVKGHGGPGGDALSVFAVFDSAADNGAAKDAQAVRLGQVFSTGLAAQNLTLGYCQRKSDECVPKVDPNRDVLPPATKTHRPVAAGDRPYQSPLVYQRTDMFGFDIGGSAATQGVQFTLGYSSRNVALIPVVAVGAGGRVSHLLGDDGAAAAARSDAYSVLGQFRSHTATRHLGYGFERFFATGVAATHLSRGLRAEIAAASPQPAASAAVAGAATTALRAAADR